MSKRRHSPREASVPAAQEPLRIIGGTHRGRKLVYEPHELQGAKVTRPMKHRVREAIFNLVGPRVEGKHALDLFAGTGALGLEALSRGAVQATFIERHLPTAEVVRQNIAELAEQNRADLLTTSAFLWAKRDLPRLRADPPWLVFVSPPYDFYVEQSDSLLTMMNRLLAAAPIGSLFVVEADMRFDFRPLPLGVREDRHAPGWDVREYPPAVVGVLEIDDLTQNFLRSQS
ncbi:MAG: RsmD family RNA methyltransferase [Planctomycetales bacterium]|nr:RsmD family RNA methyltransferase [Planctomycetales bacterium]